MEQQIASAEERPALDEETFQQLLEAAHVLQEQKAFEVANRPKPDPAEAIAKIVETQELLRLQPADLQVSAHLIAERLQEITHATGVAIALLRNDHLEYCAATGDATTLTGSHLPLDSSLLVDGDLSTSFTQEHADKQSVALPLRHEGKLAGLLEIRFAEAESIEEPDMRSCQLMAGLMTEAIARAADREWRQALAAERAAMLEALQRIKPQLERLAVSAEPVARPDEKAVEFPKTILESHTENAESRVALPVSEASGKSGRETICSQCGYQFGEHELFCGRCGTARPTGTMPSGDLQSKWASMWHLQQEAENKKRDDVEKNESEIEAGSDAAPHARHSFELSSELPPELQKVMAQFPDEPDEVATSPDAEPEPDAEGAEPALSVQPEPQNSSKTWGSASNARQWLESLNSKSAAGVWLARHRADVYVGAALVLLLIVLSGWGMRPAEDHVQTKSPPQPSLTLFEKLLVSFGLAEKPPAPVYLGNPNAPVWIDLHTALYYCADSDLYGKTPGGKFTTQRDAQLDQFEPAARRNCD